MRDSIYQIVGLEKPLLPQSLYWCYKIFFCLKRFIFLSFSIFFLFVKWLWKRKRLPRCVNLFMFETLSYLIYLPFLLCYLIFLNTLVEAIKNSEKFGDVINYPSPGITERRITKIHCPFLSKGNLILLTLLHVKEAHYHY